ncbi:MAG: universal stress protein [Desulforhopalus sp.]|nr:universal stress protein [Desulforhopalus sp.]
MKYLLGFNGSEEAKAALVLARSHAEVFRAKVYIITSMSGGSSEKPEEIDKTSRDLNFAENFLKEKGVECETFQLARGRSPGEDVVSFAEQHGIDQIYVGIEKKSRTQKLLLGSTAQYIILKAPCPVVSVNRLFL